MQMTLAARKKLRRKMQQNTSKKKEKLGRNEGIRIFQLLGGSISNRRLETKVGRRVDIAEEFRMCLVYSQRTRGKREVEA
jgi:hypothetical protein